MARVKWGIPGAANIGLDRVIPGMLKAANVEVAAIASRDPAKARAGKHVLCEKPVAMSVADAEALRACPKGRLVTEAFRVRFHPQWIQARKHARSGRLGEVWALQMLFAYNNPDPANIATSWRLAAAR